MKPIKWRDPMDHEENEAVGRACGIECKDESLAVQSAAEDADINVITRRIGLSPNSKLPPAPVDPRYYGDFSDVPDLRTALDLVRDAQVKFDSMPADLRAKFSNDPAQLWLFVNNPKNFDEAVSLGLLRGSDSGTDNADSVVKTE